MIPVVLALIWPKIQLGMAVFKVLYAEPLEFMFVFLERILIPFGLHHIYIHHSGMTM